MFWLQSTYYTEKIATYLYMYMYNTENTVNHENFLNVQCNWTSTCCCLESGLAKYSAGKSSESFFLAGLQESEVEVELKWSFIHVLHFPQLIW